MEKQLLKKSGTPAIAITFILLGFWFGFSELSLGAYNEKNLTKQFLAEDSEIFKTVVIEVGSDTVARIIAGTSSMVRTGTSSYQYQPRIQYDGATGMWSFKGVGGTQTTAFGTVTAAYVAAEIGSTAANYVLQNNGSSAGQLVTNPTLSGSTTVGTTSTITADGTTFPATKVKYLAAVDESIEPHFTTVETSISNHAHAGTDSVKISHNNVLGSGTNSHPIIDTFIASKAQASGLASLDTNSLVVQNPASGTSTPGVSKIPISLGTGFIHDSWLSSVISKLGGDIQLGTETTGNTDNITEGSTNKYHTDARVTAVIGSSSISDFSDTHNLGSATEGQFAKKVGGVWQGAASSVLTYWSDILGAPHTGTTSNSYFKTNTLNDNKILIGKPQVLPITATTTSYTSGDFQLINLQSGTSSSVIFPQGTQTETQLLMRMHGTTTVDSSDNNYAVTAFGVIGTTGVTFNTGSFSAYFSGANDRFTLADGDYLTPSGTNSSTYRLKFLVPSVGGGSRKFMNQAGGGGAGLWYWEIVWPGVHFYHEDSIGNPVINIQGGSITANTIHYAEVDIVGSSMYLFLDGNRVAAGTTTQSIGNSNQILYIGINSGLNEDFTGYMKDIEILQGVALHTATFTVDTTTNYKLATMNRQAICSTDGIERITVQTYSTDTAKPAIIFNNGSVTAFGYNAESGMSALGSSNVYSTESLNAEIATNFVVKSKDAKGRNFQRLTETCLDKVVNINLWSWNPINNKNVNRLEAEAIAKEAFVKQGKQDWELLHADEYILATTVNGTETAIIRDYVRMEKDYKYYIELEWAYSLEQTGWIDAVKDNLESDTTIRRRGFRYDDSTTPEELKEPGGIGLSEATALSYRAIQELEAIVGSLSTTLKNQEIEYNEEVDNLYNLINAIIVALLAVGGGASGWATIRRKRKGT